MAELIEDVLRDVPATAVRMGNISPLTLYKWLQVGKLEKIHVGGRVMISESAVQRFLADCKESPSMRGKRGKTRQKKA